LIDGAYRSKLGNLVLARADTVVWLDLPRRVWLPRLLRRTIRRLLMQEQLWNGNRETLRGVLWAPDALIPIAWRSFAARRHRYPKDLASYPVLRLRSRRAVAQFLATARRDEVTSLVDTTRRVPASASQPSHRDRRARGERREP
jgi:hypothetical protein